MDYLDHKIPLKKLLKTQERCRLLRHQRDQLIHVMRILIKEYNELAEYDGITIAVNDPVREAIKLIESYTGKPWPSE